MIHRIFCRNFSFNPVTPVHPVEILIKDSQSNPNRAAEVAAELILKNGIDLMLVGSTPENANPVSDQCELNGVPCISTTAPWQPWFDIPGRVARDTRVIFGHWSALGLLQRARLLGLDTGCVWGGSLTAVNLDDPEMARVSNSICVSKVLEKLSAMRRLASP